MALRPDLRPERGRPRPRARSGKITPLLYRARPRLPPFFGKVYKDRIVEALPKFPASARHKFITLTFILYYWLSSGDLQFKILIREAVQEG
jgi:hypothetical protein